MRKALTKLGLCAALGMVLASPVQAATGVKISEWMYSGTGGEFIEFSNFGPAPVDFTGWSYDDDSRLPGTFSLTGMGTVAVGEAVVITEDPAATFRAAWSLPSSIKVLGEYTNNIGRADEINIFDASGALVDRLTYGDAVFAGSPRTQNASGRPATLAALGVNDPTLWVLSTAGDVAGSYASSVGDIGNPGIAPVPEPETYAMMLAGLAAVGFALRRRRVDNSTPRSR